jgi:ADP-ribose pyrophosphatase
LEEETGHRAGEWERIADFWVAPGFCSENIVLFLARDLTLAGADALEPDADEELELLRVSAADLVASSRDAKTLLAASWLLRHTEDPS